MSDGLFRVVPGGALRAGSTSLGGLMADPAVKPSLMPASVPADAGAAV